MFIIYYRIFHQDRIKLFCLFFFFRKYNENTRDQRKHVDTRALAFKTK